MGYYAFQLEELDCRHPRSQVTDVDIVSFGVAVNSQPHGMVAGKLTLGAGSRVPMEIVNADVPSRWGLTAGGWIVGPIYAAPDDLVQIIYSGLNVSDTPQGSDEKIAPLELKILDAYYGAMAGVAFDTEGAGHPTRRIQYEPPSGVQNR